MNCLEFRRVCLGDPYTVSEKISAHRSTCRDCARFAESVDVFDKKLQDAMTIPVPGDLATRVKLRQVIGEEQARRARPWRWAMAAGILVTVSLSGIFGYQVYTTNQYIKQLQVAVLHHVDSEPEFLQVEAKQPEEKFRRVMAAFGADVVGDMRQLRHADICAMNKQPIAHTVFNGQTGRVTVLYIIGKRVQDEIPIRAERRHGVLIPAGQGNLAIIAPQGEHLDLLVNKLKRSIRWST